MSEPQVVEVNFMFEYIARDGSQVSIKPNERYILVAKTNDHWWHVRKDETTKPFFIPAQYVTVLPPEISWTFPEPPDEEGLDPPKPFSEMEPANTKQSLEVTIRDPMSIKRDSEKDGHRISTFIIPQDLFDLGLVEPDALETKALPEPEPCRLIKDTTQEDVIDGGTPSSPLPDEDECPYAVSPPECFTVRPLSKEPEPGSASSEARSPRSPVVELKEDIQMLKRAGWDLKIWDLIDDGIYQSIDDGKVETEPKDNQAELTPTSPASPSAPSTPVSTKEQPPGSPTDIPDPPPEKVPVHPGTTYVVLDSRMDRGVGCPCCGTCGKSGDRGFRHGCRAKVREGFGDGGLYGQLLLVLLVAVLLFCVHKRWRRSLVKMLSVADRLVFFGESKTRTMVDYYAKVQVNCRPKTAMAYSLESQRFLRRGLYSRRALLGVQVKDDDLSAVYVNVPRARQSISDLPVSSTSALSSSWGIPDIPDSPPELPDTFRLGSEGWEIHTDEDSGQQYYYQPSTGRSTWDYPLSPTMEADVGTEDPPTSPSPIQSPACSPPGPSLPRWGSDWEKVLDESSGRHYYFNPVSGESSWNLPDDLLDDGPPPLPEEDYPAEEDFPVSPDPDDAASLMPFPPAAEYSLAHVKKAPIPRACLDRSTPAGWTLNIDPDGAWVFTSDHTQEQWIKSLDERGQTYYYLRDGSKSQWNLPELSAGLGQCRVGNGGMVNQDGVRRSWRNSTGSQDERLSVSHRRNASDSDASSSPEMHHNLSNLEKAGILNRTKICENGKKVRKNWALSWTVLHGGVLTFHKDPKSNPTGAASKTNQFVPEFTVDLKGATLVWAPKEKSSKKNVLELKSRAGAEFLVQYDTESIITDWHKVITDTIRQLDVEPHHTDDEEEVSEKSSNTDKEDRSAVSIDKRRMSNARQLSASSASEADQKKVRNKLRKFLLKRPTLQSVKEKGYIRENVFGCHLHNLCAQENSTVPSFVAKCVRTVEKRGLGIDGIYRVSGNLAVIQKLRFKADHAEDLNLEEGNWDIHVITGALKLFFRELQEPLFPYSHFSGFVQGIKIQDYHSRVSYMSDLVRSLPPENHDTMEVLFSHLRKVIEHGDENRMTVQNVAIVFGPTLLKPEVESSNITMYMVFQNQIIEFILNEFETIFHM
ncbi:hypothetical protein NFI96_020486 [Prochilodus magdalenae]|nr:hypothetical protein NFI96_020486 [Prochilodus magdalenae]